MSEQRLIDANALKERAKTMLKIIGEDNLSDYEQGKKNAFETAIDFINNAPTVEYPFYQEAYQTGYEEGKNERPQGECRTCIHRDPEDKKCDCGGLERQGCYFPVSDDYFCKFYEKGGAE